VSLYVTLVVLLAIGGVMISFEADGLLEVTSQPTVLGVLLFVALGLALDLTQHRIAYGASSGSIAFIVFLSAAMVFGPTWGAGTTAVTIAASQILIRKPAVRIAFNVAQTILSLLFGSAVYLALGGDVPPTVISTSIIPFVAMVTVYFLTNSTAVSGVIALSERKRFGEVWQRNTLQLLGYDLVASSVALGAAWLYGALGALAIVLVVIPIVFLRHAYAVNYRLQATNRELLNLMVKAIEARDPYTSGHSQRVSELAQILARELKLSFKEVENIATAALLHDVGKIYDEFAAILQKEGRLTREEQALMQTHPSRSADLVGTISSLHGEVYRCVRHHHENFDGSGYPDGLTGDQIPTGARIIMVADTIDAMTTDRPYRKALPFDRVLQELEKYSGRQFDPAVVRALHRSVEVKQLVERPELPTEGLPVPDLGRVEQLVAH
jgi:HD superfamily phosphohydrolase YqeK